MLSCFLGFGGNAAGQEGYGGGFTCIAPEFSMRTSAACLNALLVHDAYGQVGIEHLAVHDGFDKNGDTVVNQDL